MNDARGPRPLYVYGVGLALLGLTLMPVARPKHYDSFPWSSFPMFAHTRKTTKTVVHHVVGRTEGGARRRLPPRVVANDEVLQASVTIHQAIRRGHAQRLCRKVARAVAERSEYQDIAKVDVVTDRYDSIAFFQGDTRPRSSSLHARCRVPREAGR